MATPSVQRSLTQCFSMGLFLATVMGLLWFFFPWAATGHAIGAVGTAIAHGLHGAWGLLRPVLMPIGRVLGGLAYILLWTGKTLLLWAAVAPQSFLFVMVSLTLAVGCFYFKLTHDQIDGSSEDKKRWKENCQSVFWFGCWYLFMSFAFYGRSHCDESESDYRETPYLHHQLQTMDATDSQVSFSAWVTAANQKLMADYAGDKDFLIQVVDDQARTAQFRAVLNLRTCRDLADPSSAFTATWVNGQTVHTTQDIEHACRYGVWNDVHLVNRTDRWPRPEATPSKG